MVMAFRSIGRHYDEGRGAVVAEPGYRPRRETHTMVVLVGGVNKGVLHGVQYARSLNPDRIMAVTVASDDDDRQAHRAAVARVRGADRTAHRVLAVPRADRGRS